MSITDASEPISLYAGDGVSCPSPGHVITARGHVQIQQGDLQINADEIHLYFAQQNPQHALDARSSASWPLPNLRQSPLLWISAHGHVKIQTKHNTLSADQATYTLSTQEMTAKGRHITLANPQWTLYAHECLTYGQQTGQVNARGRVRLIKGTQGLESQHLRAQLARVPCPQKQTQKPWIHLSNTAEKGLEFQWFHSPGPIRIWDTQKQYVTQSKTAVFYPLKKKLHLWGNVQIEYQKKYITGHRAILDFHRNTICVPPSSGEKLYALIPAPSSTRKKP